MASQPIMTGTAKSLDDAIDQVAYRHKLRRRAYYDSDIVTIDGKNYRVEFTTKPDTVGDVEQRDNPAPRIDLPRRFQVVPCTNT